jgi:hypothetical protein
MALTVLDEELDARGLKLRGIERLGPGLRGQRNGKSLGRLRIRDATERVNGMGGEWKVDSRSEDGTRVQLSMGLTVPASSDSRKNSGCEIERLHDDDVHWESLILPSPLGASLGDRLYILPRQRHSELQPPRPGNVLMSFKGSFLTISFAKQKQHLGDRGSRCP